jgi:probable regulatory domain-containing protein
VKILSETIPLKPLGKEDIRRLELALILGTLLREDVLEKIRNAEDRLTWLDSLIVAAGALARERANYTIEKISEELGRSESTVRNHLTGKTEAGKLVKETYENIKTKGGILELPIFVYRASEDELESLKEQLSQSEKRLKELEDKLRNVKEKLSKIVEELSS